MKKILLVAMATITVLGGFTHKASADACSGLPQVVQWRRQADAPTAGTVFLQTTKGMPAGSTDTTQWIAFGGQRLPNVNAKTDSAAFGAFVVYIDSSATYAPGQTTITAVIEGAWLPQAAQSTTPLLISDANIQSLGSFTITPTTGAKSVPVPVYANPVGSAIGFASGPSRSPSFIRMRFSSSAAMNAARCVYVPVVPCSNP